LIFTALYLIIGIDQLRGVSSNQSDFFNAFSFSAQTFTTVGYGAISPNGKGASILAMIEAYAGLLSFALATGLLYGRFSKPSLKIIFSENLLLTPYENGMSFMFKMVNTRNNVLLNTKVTTLFIMDKGIGAEEFNKEYFPLNLESDKVNFFPLTWTLVHKIDENSPAFEISLSELKKRNAEIIIMVETFDETFGQMLIQKHSYANEKWIEGKKFDRNFRMDEEGKLVLHINELNNLTSI
jgi:inward rectifier potassium channel